jgi:acetyl esterase/lipase
MRRKTTLFNLLSLIFVFSRLAAPLPAQEATKAPAAKRPPDVTPVTLDGAETHVFHTAPQGEMRLHVFKPAGWRAGDRRPALVWFFGGGWTTGTPTNAAGWAKIAAGWGMVGIAPDYRTKGRHDTPPQASVADARAAMHWVQTHAKELGIDPAKVAAGGNSAGGHVALWTAIAKAPPGSDANKSPLVKPAALVLTAPVSDTSRASGYTPSRFGEEAEALSPLHQLDGKMPPLLLFHGDSDKTVPQRQSIALDEKYRATGNACEFVSVPGGSHNFGGEMPEWREKTREMTRVFFVKQGLIKP